MNRPQEGITTEVQILRVVDGDTMEVQIVRTFHVRLTHPAAKSNLIFDTPEKNTAFGRLVMNYVKDLVNNFKGTARLFIPAGKSIDLTDVLSFRRILGEIWLDNERLSDILIEKGYGRVIEDSKRVSTPWIEPSKDGC